VEILHSVEGGDVEQVCSNLETILSYLRSYFSLPLSLVFVYLACLYYLSLYMLDILVLKLNICLGLFTHTCINQESHSGTSTLNLEES